MSKELLLVACNIFWDNPLSNIFKKTLVFNFSYFIILSPLILLHFLFTLFNIEFYYSFLFIFFCSFSCLTHDKQVGYHPSSLSLFCYLFFVIVCFDLIFFFDLMNSPTHPQIWKFVWVYLTSCKFVWFHKKTSLHMC